MAKIIKGCEARIGDLVRHRDGHVVTIKERKIDVAHFSPGWWLVEGGGLADRAIDEGDWTIIRKAAG